jgi:hypothetical protein
VEEVLSHPLPLRSFAIKDLVESGVQVFELKAVAGKISQTRHLAAGSSSGTTTKVAMLFTAWNFLDADMRGAGKQKAVDKRSAPYGLSKSCDSRERRPEVCYASPYFQYDGIGRVNWTFAANRIFVWREWVRRNWECQAS